MCFSLKSVSACLITYVRRISHSLHLYVGTMFISSTYVNFIIINEVITTVECTRE